MSQMHNTPYIEADTASMSESSHRAKPNGYTAREHERERRQSTHRGPPQLGRGVVRPAPGLAALHAPPRTPPFPFSEPSTEKHPRLPPNTRPAVAMYSVSQPHPAPPSRHRPISGPHHNDHRVLIASNTQQPSPTFQATIFTVRWNCHSREALSVRRNNRTSQ